ncbi:hypothetical protein CFC21_101326 [Triticum aestivum]|uniref:Rieske domain-containing protein n=2 Tax=Triticum aestivum TaxID=4565 RepID=A0A3B6SDX9_WHEAT|nr:protochlorophyllide-dependent translocon component 52, chloroplastic-like [Triticum aestivum]KAF7099726.1 hypothetical protein CFC21_101326 [Triticum aestivum]
MDPLRILLPRAQAQPLLPLPAGVPAPSFSPRLVPRRRARRHRNGAARMLPASAVASESPWTEQEPASGEKDERFDWLDQWYPFAPVEDLDLGAPHGKMVLGIRVVAWYDRGAGEWLVFDDACPHRLAPLSEGRIDDKGRLQCVYHGWCFDGRGACKFIPQAPALGPPVHNNSKACVASYPCVVQNKILWFYPRAEPEHRDVLQRKRPPFIKEIDDPSFVTSFLVRDMPYGYDVLAENLMDPSHVPYAHKGLLRGLPRLVDPGREEYDKEGGVPMAVKVEDSSVNGFASSQGPGYSKFVAPCTYYGSPASKKSEKNKPHIMLVFIIVPVAPGRSRVMWAFPRNFGLWLHKITPRWFDHIGVNAILDSDMYLLHIEERNFAKAGIENWQKSVYVPTSSDGTVVAFRNWFRKYCRFQVGWAAPTVDQLPATPTKDKLMDRYWSHVAQCTSCSAALKAMKALEVALQVASIAVVGLLAVAKGTLLTSVVQRAVIVSAAVLCFAASRWLADFIQKNFYFEDYVHAYK